MTILSPFCSPIEAAYVGALICCADVGPLPREDRVQTVVSKLSCAVIQLDDQVVCLVWLFSLDEIIQTCGHNQKLLYDIDESLYCATLNRCFNLET